jgi:ribose 5-phosphate isomerase B
MRVAVAVDHAGYPLKETVVSLLERSGHEVLDCGTDSSESVDYPVHAARAARLLSDGEVDRAVLACGTGTGVSIVANKFPGVRAVNARDPEDAEMSRRHNDANAVALSGRRLSPIEAGAIVESFLGTEFEGGRHGRRVAQIGRIESEYAPDKGNPEHAEQTT